MKSLYTCSHHSDLFLTITAEIPVHWLANFHSQLEIVFTIAAPAFDILFIGCELNTKIVYTTAEKLTFEAFIDLQMLQDATRRWQSS